MVWLEQSLKPEAAIAKVKGDTRCGKMADADALLSKREVWNEISRP